MCKGRSWYARFCLASKGIKLHQLIREKEKVSGELFPRLLSELLFKLSQLLSFSSTWISDIQPLVKSLFNRSNSLHGARFNAIRVFALHYVRSEPILRDSLQIFQSSRRSAIGSKNFPIFIEKISSSFVQLAREI